MRLTVSLAVLAFVANMGQVIKTAAGAGLGLLLQPIAPQPAHAVKQSKQELLLLAGAIQKEVAVLKEAAVLAEADWKPKDNNEAQKQYNTLQTLLRGGQLSQLRGTCFHLYRDHLVEPAQYKEAEQLYKKMLSSVDRLNTLLLKASRDELKKDDIKSIAPAMNEFSTQLDAFVKVAS